MNLLRLVDLRSVRLENTTGNHNKFYEIYEATLSSGRVEVVTRHGRIGTNGRWLVANRLYADLRQEKLRGGYGTDRNHPGTYDLHAATGAVYAVQDFLEKHLGEPILLGPADDKPDVIEGRTVVTHPTPVPPGFTPFETFSAQAATLTRTLSFAPELTPEHVVQRSKLVEQLETLRNALHRAEGELDLVNDLIAMKGGIT